VTRKLFSFRVVIFIAIAIFVVSGSYWMGTLSRSTWCQSSTKVPEFKIFWEAWSLVEKNFYGELPPPKTMTYAALRGALSALNDPYTTFVEPQPRQLEKDDLHGSFGGSWAWTTPRLPRR